MGLKEYKVVIVLLGIISIVVVGVCIWTVAAPIKVKSPQQVIVNVYDDAGHSPRIGIAAGILLLITSVCHFFTSLENKQNRMVGVLFLFLSFVLSAAAMGVAASNASDLNKVIKLNSIFPATPEVAEWMKALKEIVVRLTAVAAVTGIASGFEIVALIMGGLLLKSVGGVSYTERNKILNCK